MNHLGLHIELKDNYDSGNSHASLPEIHNESWDAEHSSALVIELSIFADKPATNLPHKLFLSFFVSANQLNVMMLYLHPLSSPVPREAFDKAPDVSQLKGRNVLVTGGASGLEAATAKRLGEMG